MQPTENWYAEKTAFLVIHGNGPHREYETLDKFVSKFYKLLQDFEVDLHDLEHRLDDKAQSYVRLKLKRSEYPYIDFYEYYWDRFMIRDITEKELKDFIKTVYEGLKRGRNYYIWDTIFNPRKGDAPIFLQLFGLPPWLARLLTRVNPISKWMIEYAKDVPIYCQNEQRSIYYQIRKDMLSGAVKALTDLLNSDYDQVIVVGHSLGSVIAYDALNRIARDLSSPQPPVDEEKDNQNPPLDDSKVQKIKGLVTFGSFLDMVAFFFEAEKRAPRGKKVEQRIAYARHAFRKPPKPPGAGYTTNPINYSKLCNVKWLNFYHQHDFVANQRLRMYDFDLAQDQQIDMYELHKKDKKQRNTKASNADNLKWWEWLLFNIPGPGKWPGPKEWKKSTDAHNSYWEDDKMYEKIAEKFISKGFNTSSPSGIESKTHTGRLV